MSRQLAPEWQEAIDAFATDLAHKRRTGRTIDVRRYHLERFAESVAVPPQRVRLEHITSYLFRPEWGGNSFNVVRSSLRQFFLWAKKNNRVQTDLGNMLPPAVRVASRSVPATQADIEEAIARAQPKVRLMVMLSAIAGLKVSEIAACHPRQISKDADGKFILHAQSASGRVRRVILRPDVAEAILAGEEGFTFPGKINGHFSPAYVARLISAALPENVSSEQLRHAFRESQATLAWRDLANYHTPRSMRIAEHPDLKDRVNVAHHLARIESAQLNEDPELVIGSSKELMESVFKIVLKDREVVYGKGDDLLNLYGKVADSLAASAPGDVAGRESIKRLMRTLISVVQSVAELRGTMGTGHGSESDPVAEARHARLAFNATVTIVEYISDSWRATKRA